MPCQLTIVSRAIALSALLLLALFAPAAGQGNEAQRTAVATFAGGCFWCVEADFDKVEGVISTTSGYTGGDGANPPHRPALHPGAGRAPAVGGLVYPAHGSANKLVRRISPKIDPPSTRRPAP